MKILVERLRNDVNDWTPRVAAGALTSLTVDIYNLQSVDYCCNEIVEAQPLVEAASGAASSGQIDLTLLVTEI